MNADSSHSKLDSFWSAAFGRSLGVVTPEELRVLARARVAIPGLGGVGGAHLITLVRSGIGKFNIADPDVFEIANFNRQFGARVETIGKSKVEVMKSDALAINPHLEINVFPKGVSPDNIDEFLTGVDVIVDGIDFFAWRARRMVYTRARQMGIPVVAAGPLGMGQSLLVFTPTGMSFDEYYGIRDDSSDVDACLRFLIGTTPAMAHRHYVAIRKVRLDRGNAPSFATACVLDAGAASTEVVRLLLGWPGLRAAPHYLLYDPRLKRLFQGKLRWGNAGPLQRLKLFLAHREISKTQRHFRPTPVPPPWDGTGALPDAVRDHLLTAGIQAPSLENDQPWKFRAGESRVDVLIDRPSDPPLVNPRYLASAMTAGSVIENIRIAATAYGLSAEVVEAAPDDPEGRVATLRFVPGAQVDPLVKAVWDRETNRHDYDPRPLHEESTQALIESVRPIPGARLHLVSDPARMALFKKAVQQTLVARFEILSEQRHLSRLLRGNTAEAKRRGDGVTARNLLLRPGAAVFLPFLTRRPSLALMNGLGIARLLAWDLSRGVTRSAAIGFVTMPGIGFSDFLAGGRALERVWLRATSLGLSLQPLAGIPLFWLRQRLEGSEESFPVRARPPLRQAMRLAREAWPEINFDQEGAVMMFRVGRALRNLPEGTFRKPLSEFMVKGNPG